MVSPVSEVTIVEVVPLSRHTDILLWLEVTKAESTVVVSNWKRRLSCDCDVSCGERGIRPVVEPTKGVRRFAFSGVSRVNHLSSRMPLNPGSILPVLDSQIRVLLEARLLRVSVLVAVRTVAGMLGLLSWVYRPSRRSRRLCMAVRALVAVSTAACREITAVFL